MKTESGIREISLMAKHQAKERFTITMGQSTKEIFLKTSLTGVGKRHTLMDPNLQAILSLGRKFEEISNGQMAQDTMGNLRII